MAHEDDSPSYLPGPLDELVPGLRKKVERLPALPVHPRIVQARRDDGSVAIVMASFAQAANVKALHAALKPLVEAALLTELSRTPEELAQAYAPVRALELYAFFEHGFDASPALGAFGFAPAALTDTSARKALSLVRREAQLVEGLTQDEPLSRYVAGVSPSTQPLAEALHRALRSAKLKGPWGTEPGALAKTLSTWLEAQGFPGVGPTREGIEKLESLVVHTRPAVIRWIEPLTFQALCDLIAVAAHTTWGMEVEWGVCEPDDETGLAPPPVIRVHRDGEAWHVPLGEHVLRWCVMPAQAGESIPSLGAWAEHEFA